MHVWRCNNHNSGITLMQTLAFCISTPWYFWAPNLTFQLSVLEEVHSGKMSKSFPKPWLKTSLPISTDQGDRWVCYVYVKPGTQRGRCHNQQVVTGLVENYVVLFTLLHQWEKFWHWIKNNRRGETSPYQILLPSIRPFTRRRRDKATQEPLWSDWKRREVTKGCNAIFMVHLSAILHRV